MKNKIFSGYWGRNHCQGIAVDKKGEFLYYSFTTKIIKSDLEGNIIGSVGNIIGHLGCIDFCDIDRKLYASLEYKNDAIGKGILNTLDRSESSLRDGFYIAIFDVDKIDRMDMDAECDGIMKTVYLKTVVDDYEAVTLNNGDKREHRHGCSGIDGVTFGPDFGKTGKEYLYVSYGIYSDLDRTDNDYQVILQYDASLWWDKVAKPLSQSNFHTFGPEAPRNKFFLYTGNTTYGIQNLEYDPFTGDFFAFVYRGQKPQFPNFPTFVIDASKAPVLERLKGYENGEKGLVLSLKRTGLEEGGISGMEFPFGTTGFYAFGDGRYFVSEEFSKDKEHATNVCLYRLKITDGKWELLKEEIII